MRPGLHAVASAAVAAGALGIVALCRRRLSAARTPSITPTAVFFGPATEFVEPVRALLTTEWKIESASSDDMTRAKQASEATCLVGGLALANTMLRESGPNLRLLQVHFAGTDWLDSTAVPAGVQVCNATGMEIAIAEWVLGAMLKSIDRIGEEDAKMRESCMAAAENGADLGFAPPFFATPRPSTRTELSACTVGIVGYGNIGKNVAIRAAAFGCRVIATRGRSVPSSGGHRGGAEFADLPALLEKSDFVVVACPLNEKTVGLIGAAQLASMKRTAYLINVARGAVVDEAALYTALRDGAIGGAAIDVWYRLPEVASGQRECAPYDLAKHPFHALPNVILSPHTSGWSGAQIERRIALMAANLDAVARGRSPRNVVFSSPA